MVQKVEKQVLESPVFQENRNSNLEFKLDDLKKIDIDDTAEFFDFLESDDDQL